MRRKGRVKRRLADFTCYGLKWIYERTPRTADRKKERVRERESDEDRERENAGKRETHARP